MAISALPSVPETLGAASSGFNLSCGFFGVLTTLSFIYYRKFYDDAPVWKLLVAAVWVLELVDQVFVGYSVHYYSITHHGNSMVMFAEDLVWPLLAQVVIGNFVGTVVKTCFAFRVWRLSRRNLAITIPIIVLILTQTGCAITYCVRGFQLNRLIFAPRLRVIASIALGTGMVTDIGIAATLCILLRKLRTGFKKSDTIIDTLIVYAINTGALTAIFSGLTLTVYNVWPNTFYFMTFYFQIGKLYGISFLCTLNTRRSVHGRGTDKQGTSGLASVSHGRATSSHAVWSSYNRGAPSQSNVELKSLEIAVTRQIDFA